MSTLREWVDFNAGQCGRERQYLAAAETQALTSCKRPWPQLVRLDSRQAISVEAKIARLRLCCHQLICRNRHIREWHVESGFHIRACGFPHS